MFWQKQVPEPPAHKCATPRWDPIATSYRPPVRRGSMTGFIDVHTERVFTEGITTITQQCVLCGYTDSTRHYGHVQIPGFVDTTRKTA